MDCSDHKWRGCVRFSVLCVCEWNTTIEPTVCADADIFVVIEAKTVLRLITQRIETEGEEKSQRRVYGRGTSTQNAYLYL